MMPLIILLLFILGCIVFYFIQLSMRHGTFEAFRPVVALVPPLQKFLFSNKTIARWRTHLSGFTYFQSLPLIEQEKFLERIKQFILGKRISGNRLKVTEEMRVKLGACAVQLFFGLEEYSLPYYDTIFIYPTTFSMRRGEYEALATRDGEIHISWKAFEKGYASPDDAYNTGLYVFAQAMQLGIEMFPGDDPALAEEFGKWESASSDTIRRIKGKAISPIPVSATQGKKMFFASCIEYFFEAPEKLNMFHPELYGKLVMLLHQDPLNKEVLRSSSSQPSFAVVWRKQRKLTYLYVFAFVTGILGLPGLIALAGHHAINDYVLILIPIVVAGYFLVPPLFRPKEGRLLAKSLIPGSIGFGLWAAMLLLLLNMAIPLGDEIIETYAIEHIETTEFHSRGGSRYGGSRSGSVSYLGVYTFSGNAYGSCTLLRSWYFENAVKRSSHVRLTFHRGLFGIKVLDNTEWIATP